MPPAFLHGLPQTSFRSPHPWSCAATATNPSILSLSQMVTNVNNTPPIYMSPKKYESRGVTKPRHYRRTARLHELVKMAALPLLFLLLTAVTRGQSALDGFDPNVDGISGIAVNAMAVQPDGKILIGGSFNSAVGGQVRNRIARLNPDGTLDTAFNPNANDYVGSIAVQSDGKILVAGAFTNIGGQPRNRIARLDGTTGMADSFDPNANSYVTTLVVQADGKILVGGNFTSIGGATRNYLARLDATTGLADSFNPSADGLVSAIALQADGKVLVGGGFNNIGGQARDYIARVDASTGLADSFNPSPDSNPFVNGVYSIAIQADGKILAGGPFFNIGG